MININIINDYSNIVNTTIHLTLFISKTLFLLALLYKANTAPNLSILGNS